MDLRDSLNRYYYDVTVSDLRQISRTGGGELSYNSIMYLDVISYQRAQGWRYVGYLPTMFSGEGGTKEVDLIFERSRKLPT